MPEESIEKGSEFSDDELQLLKKTSDATSNIRKELGKVIVGQDKVIDQLLIAIFSKGHCLLEGVPGLAKTLMVSTMAKCLKMDFSRIQFTPDMLPADLIGTLIFYNKNFLKKRDYYFQNYFLDIRLQLLLLKLI